MKVEIIDHRNGNHIEETNSGIYLYDNQDNQYRLSINKFGELEIQASDGSLCICPKVANEIVLKTV